MAGATPDAGVVLFTEGGLGQTASCCGSPWLIGGSLGPRPAGLALQPDDSSQDFRIAVLDAAGAECIVLGPYPEEEVVAVWRGLGSSSGLPLYVRLAGGLMQLSLEQIGRVQLGRIRIRRRHGLLNGRRPRFLVRRKVGRFPARPRVHRELELSSVPGR